MVLSAHLRERAEANGRSDPVVRSAPTGVAAHGISGRTLHALFRLPVKASAYAPLTPQNLASVQASLRNCMYLVINEKSMISLRMLAWLDQRCRQIWPERANEPSGGLNILLCGDFFQLPPVIERPLFNNKAL